MWQGGVQWHLLPFAQGNKEDAPDRWQHSEEARSGASIPPSMVTGRIASREQCGKDESSDTVFLLSKAAKKVSPSGDGVARRPALAPLSCI